MPAPRVRGDYDQLGKIAQAFGAQAESSQRTLQQVKRQMDTLQGGDWIGKGARAFYKEMEQDVLPALGRLVKALSEAQRVTLQISRIVKQAEEAAARLLGGAGLGGGAGATVGAGGGGAGAGGGGGGGGLPGWISGLIDGLNVSSWSLTGLGRLASNAAASIRGALSTRMAQMARIFAEGGEEALSRTGIHRIVAALTTDAARASNLSKWLGRASTGLSGLGAGLTALNQGMSSSAETLLGQITSGGAAGGLSFATSLPTRSNAYLFAADLGFMALGIDKDRPSAIVNSSIDTIVTTTEGLFTGSTRGMEAIHQRHLSGESGWVFQKAAEAGDFWAEHGVGGGLKMFWNEVTGLF